MHVAEKEQQQQCIYNVFLHIHSSKLNMRVCQVMGHLSCTFKYVQISLSNFVYIYYNTPPWQNFHTHTYIHQNIRTHKVPVYIYIYLFMTLFHLLSNTSFCNMNDDQLLKNPCLRKNNDKLEAKCFIVPAKRSLNSNTFTYAHIITTETGEIVF